MTDMLLPILMSLAACCAAAALLARRSGGDKRDLRLLAGMGASLGGVALLLLAIQDLT